MWDFVSMTALFLRGPGGPALTALGSTYVTMTDGSDVRGAFSLMEETFWADATPLHSHAGAEESFYVLAGEVELWADDSTSSAGAGTFITVPRGVVHGLRRISDEPVRMLTIISPPGFERIFAEVVRRGEDELLAHPDELVELAERLGTTIVGDYPARSTRHPEP